MFALILNVICLRCFNYENTNNLLQVLVCCDLCMLWCVVTQSYKIKKTVFPQLLAYDKY